jgi:uncharacterized protein (TIGR04255 family)
LESPVPTKARERALADLQSHLHAKGFGQGIRPLGFRLGGQSGQVKVELDNAPIKFDLSSAGIEAVVFPESVVYGTHKYVRWRPFFGQFQEHLTNYLEYVTDILAVRAVKLEYLDRFIWDAGWETIDYKSLLNDDSGWITPVYKNSPREWHSHSGVFQFLRDAERRLIQVNVDATEAIVQGQLQPSVGILTLIQDEFTGGSGGVYNRFSDFKGCMAAVEDIHLASKDLFANVIVPEIAKKINLNNREEP